MEILQLHLQGKTHESIHKNSVQLREIFVIMQEQPIRKQTMNCMNKNPTLYMTSQTRNVEMDK